MSASSDRSLRVVLLGCGTVGSQVARALLTTGDELAARLGVRLDLVGIAVRSIDEPRGLGVADLDDRVRPLLTEDATGLLAQADIAIELIGGIEPARSLILAAFDHGASVVTANKALLAQDGPTLYEAAAQAGVDLYFEAAVGGAIPIVGPMRQSLAGDRVRAIFGIVNGTTNFVLDEMTKTGADLPDAVARAQELGYAEADPTADVEGFDAASKAAILASLGFHTRICIDDVYREGISNVTAADVAWASETGHVIKLLAIAEAVPSAAQPGTDEGVAVRVHPAMVPIGHPLASVGGAFNAVFVHADLAGPLMFYGQGAGGRPTSSAVLGDVMAAARNRVDGARGPQESVHAQLPALPIDEVATRYQVRLLVDDRPGVLAQVAQVVAALDVSIETVRQITTPKATQTVDGQQVAELVIVTHRAADSALSTTVAQLRKLAVVRSVVSVIRVIGALSEER